ncbi:hypothetical protein FS837_013055, partial [Tulasnella sp. UAMH 9824]
LPPDPEQVRQYQERLLNVGQQRVEMAKKIIRTIDKEVQLYAMRNDRKKFYWLMEEPPSTDTFESSRRHDNEKIRLLEQALLLSSRGRHEFIWKFIAKTSIGLLLEFDIIPEVPIPNSVDVQDSQKENRLQCADILSRCLQDMRQHLEPYKFIRAVSPALDKLVDYWARFEDDFTQYPDLNDSEILNTWLEIRGVLDKPEESGWGPSGYRRFGEAYPSLKAGFEAVALAKSHLETIPQVDVGASLWEIKRSANISFYTSRTQRNIPATQLWTDKPGQTEPDGAVADRTPPTSVDHSDPPLEDAGELREHEDARDSSSWERDEQSVKQAGNADSKPTNRESRTLTYVLHT